MQNLNFKKIKKKNEKNQKIKILQCKWKISSVFVLIRKFEMVETEYFIGKYFQAVCALGYTFTAGLTDEIDDLIRPFRPRSRDALLGLWTALLVTPLTTVIVEILNRCFHRSAFMVPTLDAEAQYVCR